MQWLNALKKIIQKVTLRYFLKEKNSKTIFKRSHKKYHTEAGWKVTL